MITGVFPFRLTNR